MSIEGKLKTPSDPVLFLIGVVGWLMGMAIAKGFWPMLIATVFPPFAWFVVIDKMLQIAGWI